MAQFGWELLALQIQSSTVLGLHGFFSACSSICMKIASSKYVPVIAELMTWFGVEKDQLDESEGQGHPAKKPQDITYLLYPVGF